MLEHRTLKSPIDSISSSSILLILTPEQVAQIFGSAVGLVKEQTAHNELPVLQIEKSLFINFESLQRGAIMHASRTPARCDQHSNCSGPHAEKKSMMSIDEAAHYLDIAPKTIRKWLSNRTCPFPTVKIGDSRKVKRADLEEYVKNLGHDCIEMAVNESVASQQVQPRRGRPRKTLLA